MIGVAAIVLAIVAFAAWVGAVLAALAMLKHRRPGVSGWWYAANGAAFFTGCHFAPGAEPARQRFLLNAGRFGLALLGAMALAMITVASTRI